MLTEDLNLQEMRLACVTKAQEIEPDADFELTMQMADVLWGFVATGVYEIPDKYKRQDEDNSVAAKKIKLG